MTAALLAARGYTSSEQALEAKRGWLNVLSASHDSREITEGLGERYEISVNSYKPFACGIVIHPVIDACLQLRQRENLDCEAVRSVQLHVHPLVLELTGKTEPRSGLEGKFSVFHAAAVALHEGDGGERQFSDRAVLDAAVVALRRRVTALVDPALEPDAARVEIELADGRRLRLHVEHAIGSMHRPMSNSDLEHKFTGLSEDILGQAGTRRLLDACWQLEHVEDVAAIAAAART
jgi:2-methylcitrate dehydratase PrpD